MYKTAIIGEGKMGSGLFYYLQGFDLDLTWVCSCEADLGRIKKQFSKRINRSLEAGTISENKYHSLRQIVISQDPQVSKDCDLIIEAIPENIPLKKELFNRLDSLVQPACIFASNSSSINPSLIFPTSQRKNKVVGLHFFYPVALKNIVEFTVTPQTSSSALSAIEDFLGRIHRFYLTLDEKNSFILNKIFLDFQVEAIRIVDKGYCNYRQMDELIKTTLFPFGVFDFMDNVGIDTMLASIKNYTYGYPNKTFYDPLIIKLEALAAQGKLGFKTGEGFCKYPPEDIPLKEIPESGSITEHLRQTWISSVRRYTALSHIPVVDMDFALKEYYGLEKGPFENTIK